MNEADTPPANIDPNLEDALINRVAMDRSRYQEVREHLPQRASDAFAVRREAWEQLAQAIESNAPLVEVPYLGPACADPIDAAERLTELHWRRVLARLARGTLRDLAGTEPARHVAEALASGLAGVRDLMGPRRLGSFTWAEALIERVDADLAAAAAARARGQRTMGVAASGLPSLDLVLNGWEPGALYVLGGAPGVGKTSLALQWACEAIVDRGVVVVYFTYENSPQNLTLKAIGRLAGIPPATAQRGRADRERWRSGVERFRALAPNLALVSADAGTSMDFVEATAREAFARGSVGGLVIVDYLQRMAYGERFSSIQDNVAALAQQLRDIAVRLNIAVMAVSALAPSTDDAPLQLSALAERGELEYASDAVLLLGPRARVALASADRVRAAPTLRLLDLLIAKNRYGEANRSIPLLFRPSTGDFQEESPV